MVELATGREHAGLAGLYHQGAQSITVLTAPAALLLCFFADGVIFMWTGDERLARNTGPILSLLALGTFLNGLMGMPYHLRLAHGWTSLTVKVNTIAVLIFIPSIVWAVPRYGAVGAAWMWVALNCGYVLSTAHFMHRRLMPGDKWRWYLFDVLLPALGAAGALLLALALRPARFDDRLEWFWYLAGSGIMALAGSLMLADRMRTRCLAMVFPRQA
jgi:O-antigen/teichoic acid export membrane protein